MRSLLGLVLLVSIACCGWDQVNPAIYRPVPGNPCGNVGVECLDLQGNPNGSCCWEGETCGGGRYSVGCPAGECCDIRQTPLGGALDGGASRLAPHAQLRP